MHKLIVLLVSESAYIPVELHPIRRVLPALYEGLWACDIEQPDGRDDSTATADNVTLAVLKGCEASLQDLHDTIQSSCYDPPASPGAPAETGCDVLNSLATANCLVRQIYTALSSLPRRRRLESPNTARSDRREERPQKVVASSQAWKYSCTGTGEQHNTVQEGSGYQVITTNHRMRDDSSLSGRERRWRPGR